MGIFPPTKSGYIPAQTYYEGIIRRRGEPLRPIGYKPAHYGYTFLLCARASDISVNKLIVHWEIVIAVTFGMIFTLREKRARKQNFCLWAGIVIFVLMGIFPPARPGVPKPPLITGKEAHYVFLPSRKAEDIAFRKLIIRWGIVVAVTIGLVYIFSDKEAIKPEGEQKE